MNFVMENPLTQPSSASFLQHYFSFRLREFKVLMLYCILIAKNKIQTFLAMASETQHFNLFATMLKMEM